MAIKQIKVWMVECDKCGKVYPENDEHIYFKNKKDAILTVETDDWWERKRSKIYCGDCWKY